MLLRIPGMSRIYPWGVLLTPQKKEIRNLDEAAFVAEHLRSKNPNGSLHQKRHQSSQELAIIGAIIHRNSWQVNHSLSAQFPEIKNQYYSARGIVYSTRELLRIFDHRFPHFWYYRTFVWLYLRIHNFQLIIWRKIFFKIMTVVHSLNSSCDS